MTLTQKIIESHLEGGAFAPDEEVSVRIDQTLTQDATGTLVMLELEAMKLERTQAEVSVQYIDHNLLQLDSKNSDDHLFLLSACRKYGFWLSPAGQGVSHPVHQQRIGIPGKTLLGSDSHTPAAGALGMLAIGAGGLEVARAIAGQPYTLKTPKVWGVELVGRLPDWVSAKDIVLELLRRHDVNGGVGYVLEYYGPGLTELSAMDRHVIANMGTELGATSSVFPSDDQTRDFLTRQNRGHDWIPLAADPDCEYDRVETIDLAELEPLAAKPSSPGNVVPVRSLAGKKSYQSYIGSSANPGFRDYAVAARIVSRLGKSPEVSLDINPASSQVLSDLTKSGDLGRFIESGARIHQAGCNGCIGMGQAPASGRASLRTVPRNFPGRSGTADDQVYLVSPETAAASATRGEITDPTSLDMPYPRAEEPREPTIDCGQMEKPLDTEQAQAIELRTGPNIEPLPEFEELPDTLESTVMLKLGDNVSTDEILPAGARILPFRSNIPKISTFCFEAIDQEYAKNVQEVRDDGGHVIVAGENYGQGSSREHAALAPRYLGLRFVIAKSFARIHRSNLINFGILPLTPIDKTATEQLEPGARLAIDDLQNQMENSDTLCVKRCDEDDSAFDCRLDLSERERCIIQAGGLINQTREELHSKAS